MERMRGLASTLLIPLLWGTHSVVAKACLQGLEPAQLAAWNMVLGSLGMWVVFGTSSLKALSSMSFRLKGAALVQGVFGTTLYFVPLYWSFGMADSVIRVNLINYLFPVTTVLFCAGLGCGSMTRSRLAGLLLAFAGAGWVVTRGQVDSGLGQVDWGPDLLALAAACSWGLFSAIGSRFRIPGPVAQLVGFTSGAVWAVPFLLLRGPGSLSAWGWLGVSYIAIGSNALAGAIWLRALQRLNPALVGNIAYLAVVISSVSLWAFFHEPMGLATWIGLGLILAGALLSR